MLRPPPDLSGDGILVGYSLEHERHTAPIGFVYGGGDRRTGPESGFLTPILHTGGGHLLTIAPTGAGKGVSCIIPTLLRFPGPVIVIDRWIYGWGTLYWLPMIFVALPTFLFSVGLFSNPANVEAVPTVVLARGLAASGEPVRPAGLGDSWGISDGIWMAIRFHVPVVPLAARGSWEPTGTQAVLRLPDGERRSLPFSAEGYAFAIYLLHWIVWPLFLYGVGRKVLRDRA